MPRRRPSRQSRGRSAAGSAPPVHLAPSPHAGHSRLPGVVAPWRSSPAQRNSNRRGPPLSLDTTRCRPAWSVRRSLIPGAFSAMPMLSPMNTFCPSMVTGSRTVSISRVANASASRGSLTACLDHREFVAAEPRQRVALAQAVAQPTATVRSSASPAAWPRVSLTCLKWSRSR